MTGKNNLYSVYLLSILILISFSACQEGPGELIWKDYPDYSAAKLRIAKGESDAGLELISSSVSGITFNNEIERASIIENENVLNGSGVALGDINGDGLVDVFFAGMDVDNQLYINQGGLQFTENGQQAGVAASGIRSTGAAMVDGDGDGDLDIFVSTLGSGLLHYVNDGMGSFTRNVNRALNVATGGTSMAFSDFDRDGDVDLYLANYKYKSFRDSLEAPQLSHDNLIRINSKGERYIRPDFDKDYVVTLINDGTNLIEQLFEVGEPDVLFVNQGNNSWSPAETKNLFIDREGNGLEELPRGWGLSVQFRDINCDQWPDIYVCNDYETPDDIWINKDGVFHQIDPLALRHGSNSSMSVDFTDLNKDGELDFFVSEMLSTTHTRRKTQMGVMTATPISIGVYDDFPQYMRNNVYLNRGDGSYAEIARYSHLSSSEWSWSSIFKDIDLDGDDDLIVTTGHMYDFMDSDTKLKVDQMPMGSLQAFKETRFMYPPLDLPNLVFENKGDLHFEMKKGLGDFGTEEDVSHGMALADLDNDGDQDVVINRLNKTAQIFENQTRKPRIAVRLEGDTNNKLAIGSEIIVKAKNSPEQTKMVIAGGRYLSSDDFEKEFAAFDDNATVDVTVNWYDGSQAEWKNLPANHKYILRKVNAGIKADNGGGQEEPLFSEMESGLDHVHVEAPFNDFIVQSLLPNRLSQFGPGVAVNDLNNDGFDDLLITDGRSGHLRQIINQKGRGFAVSRVETGSNPMDDLGVLVYPNKAGSHKVLVSRVNLESPQRANSSLRVVNLNSGTSNVQELGIDMTGGLSAADYDNDGDLDLFVQGRSKPFQYPVPASSYFLKNEDGNFMQDGINTYTFKDLGLITGSVFSDIDSDGDADLLLSREWGSLILLENENGTFKDATSDYGLDQWSGWWNGLTTGDLNNDGLLDIVATNWGLNTKYHFNPEKPLQVLYKDFDNNRTLDVVEAHFDEDFGEIVPERGFSCMSNAMPFIRDEKETYQNYATSDLNQILGERLSDAEHLEANELRTGIFFNTGNGFEFTPLSMEAQITVGMAPVIFDADGDGNQDIFLSQNFFPVQIETDRNDSGRGLLLKGNGKGEFTAVKGQDSGIRIYGDQRAAAIADFNNDSRPDLVVTQNGAETKVLLNQSKAEFGKLRLIGSALNPNAIGAQVVIHQSTGGQQILEVKMGEGYLSQSSSDLFIGGLSRISKIEVRIGGSVVKTLDDIKSGLNRIEI
ncbi:MAG: VCBS repeat-containing protein [Bacteroidia bacterium]|nr:VCBS repeat-containing protein [Bacteroidia bacterium]